MTRAFTSLRVDDVGVVARFYEDLLGLRRHFDSDWFIILVGDDRPGFEFGILERDHMVVPEAIRATPQGVLLTFVVADFEAVHARATAMGAPIVEPPTDMPYGQRRMVLRDPEGTAVDVSAPLAARSAD